MFFGRHDKGIMIYFLGFVKLDFGLRAEQKRDAVYLPLTFIPPWRRRWR